MFGKGVYFTDCFSKAVIQCNPVKSASSSDSKTVYVILSEVALGDMHKAFAPHQFKRSAPQFCHSVYGVGLQKPANTGIKDLNQPGPDFAPNPETFDKPQALFLNTGKMQANTDLEEVEKNVIGSSNNILGDGMPDLKFNDFVVFDEAQIKMRYLVECVIEQGNVGC